MAKGYIKRGNTIFIKNWLITEEEKKEVADFKDCGYEVKLAKKSENKPTEKHTITANFDIPYDKVRKDDMLEYVKQFASKEEEKIKKWAQASHTEKNGKKVFSQIASKKAFFKIFFPEKWEKEIEPMLESRKFKKGKKKTEEDFFAKYL